MSPVVTPDELTILFTSSRQNANILNIYMATRASTSVPFSAPSPSSASPPPSRLYEYRPDYYATFFTDPDGIRLEAKR